MEKAIKLMEEVFLVEKKNDVACAIKGNGLKRKCDQTQEQLAVLIKEIDKSEAKTTKWFLVNV